MKVIPNVPEFWRDIPDYKGLYQVSNLGRIKSLAKQIKYPYYDKFVKEKILKPSKDNYGYRRIVLSNNKKIKGYLIHRLVAQSFIPNIDNKSYINHLDCDPSNNNSVNLEWCTHSENVKYSFNLKRQTNRGENNPRHVLTKEQVLQIKTMIQNTKKEYGCWAKIAKSLNIKKYYIYNILKKNSWEDIQP